MLWEEKRGRNEGEYKDALKTVATAGIGVSAGAGTYGVIGGAGVAAVGIAANFCR